MDEKGIRRDLNDCLIGSEVDGDVDFKALRLLRDPFAKWGRSDAA